MHQTLNLRFNSLPASYLGRNISERRGRRGRGHTNTLPEFFEETFGIHRTSSDSRVMHCIRSAGDV